MSLQDELAESAIRLLSPHSLSCEAAGSQRGEYMFPTPVVLRS